MVCMENTAKVQRGFFSRQSNLNKFFYGDTYLAFIALFTALFYCANLVFVGLCCYVALACYLLLANRDLTPFIPLPMFVVLIFRNFSTFNNGAVYLVFIPVVICLILRFIIFPVKKLVVGKLLLPLTLFMIALFLGGLLSDYFQYYLRGLVTVITLGPIILFAYFLFSQYLLPPKNFDLPKYIFTALAFLGFTCFVEAFAHMYVYVPAGQPWPNIGWGNINSAASLLLLAIPSCAYLLFYTKNTIRNLILLVLLYVAVFISRSDGVGGITLIFIPIILVATIANGKLKLNKYEILKSVTFVLICIALIAIVSIVAFNKHGELLDMLWLKLSDDTGRSGLYRQAMELFKKFPIFGVGQGYLPDDYVMPPDFAVTYSFHSSFIHTAATMGIVGLCIFIYYFVVRCKIITAKYTPYNLFAFFAFTMFEIYAAVDTGEFSVIPLMLCLTVMILAIEYTNKNPIPQPLPLLMSTKFAKLTCHKQKTLLKNTFI